MPQARLAVLCGIPFCLLAAACGPSARTTGSGAVPPTAAPVGATVIRGEVRDGRPLANHPNLVIPNELPVVSGATIRIVNLGLRATSDKDGQFRFPGIRVAPPCLKIDVAASAPGFGNWQLHGAPVYPEGSILYVELHTADSSETYQAGGAAAAGLAACH